MIHGSFALFFVFALLGLMTQRSADIDLGEGEKISLKAIGGMIGSSNENPAYIVLNRMNFSNNLNNASGVYSDVGIISGSNTAGAVISVNNPASYCGIGIYQKGFYFVPSKNGYSAVSVLRFVNSPFLFPLGISAVFFLLITGAGLFYRGSR